MFIVRVIILRRRLCYAMPYMNTLCHARYLFLCSYAMRVVVYSEARHESGRSTHANG